MGLAIFDELRLPDIPGTPRMRDACGQWFRDIVYTSFGSWDAPADIRHIRDIFAMLPKGQSKTTYSAGLCLTTLLMNKRPNAEALFVGPTQAIAENAYEKAVGMIDLSNDLKRRFRPRDHLKIIEDLMNGTCLRVKTFDVNILTGTILIMAMVDELHLLGRNAHTTKVMRQIRGGLEKTPEGLLIITTTQSDEPPTGAFRDELKMARRVRNGEMKGMDTRPTLPMLYEFPKEIASDRKLWENPDYWGLVMPNLGRSVKLPSLISDWNTEKEKGDHAIKIWASQHLNIEIGVGISDDGWRAADYWEESGDETLTLESLLERSEVVTMGIDGGGMDDLLGIAVTGRERETRKWLTWQHALAHPIVLERRKEIAAHLLDFEEEGSLTFCDVTQDMPVLAEIAAKVLASGLLPEKNAVGFDPNNIAAIIETLISVGYKDEQFWRQRQGTALQPAINVLPRKLSDGTLEHGGTALMSWCVGNAKIERHGNGVMITKQVAGAAKIDPVIALLCSAHLMSWNPAPRRAVKPQLFFL